MQILDSHNTLSDEVDVCVCNTDQPFRTDAGAPLIAEGVDFIVQVKARLTGHEIDRAVKNCRSVKALEKAFAQGDETIAPVGVSLKRLGKIPYVVFAFHSRLSPDTIHIRLEQGSAGTDLVAQIDALFVLDRGLTFINCRDGSGKAWQSAGEPVKGWLRLHSDELTLLELLRFASTQVPRIRRLVAPLSYYMPLNLGYRMVGRKPQVSNVLSQ